MKNLTVLVDMDDTIEGLLQAWVESLNKTHGTTVKKDDVTEHIQKSASFRRDNTRRAITYG